MVRIQTYIIIYYTGNRSIEIVEDYFDSRLEAREYIEKNNLNYKDCFIKKVEF